MCQIANPYILVQPAKVSKTNSYIVHGSDTNACSYELPVCV